MSCEREPESFEAEELGVNLHRPPLQPLAESRMVLAGVIVGTVLLAISAALAAGAGVEYTGIG